MGATRDVILRDLPWRVSAEQGQALVFQSLRDHGEFVVTGGETMSDYQLNRLGAFYRTLREANVVVEYNPQIPPQPGLAKNGGFALRPRRQVDGDLLIRVNEYTRLTDESRKIWRLPDIDPSVRGPTR